MLSSNKFDDRLFWGFCANLGIEHHFTFDKSYQLNHIVWIDENNYGMLVQLGHQDLEHPRVLSNHPADDHRRGPSPLHIVLR